MTDTIWGLLQHRLRANPSGPLVTFVAGADSRVELSALTLANAAIKIANAMSGELDLEPGAIVHLDLPVHWQRATWCAGAWIAGCAVSFPPGSPDPDLVVTDPSRIGDHPGVEVGTVSLHPFGLPTPGAAPAGIDLTVLTRQQPDQLLVAPPSMDGPALASGTAQLTTSGMLELARELGRSWGLGPGGRLLVDPKSPELHQWLGALAVPLVAGASVVLVAPAADLPATAASELVTARTG